MNLLLGDSYEILKGMKTGSVDLIITDPPYEVSATNGGGSINTVKKLNKSLADLDRAKITEGYDIRKFGREFVRVMKDINIYIWCNKVQIPEYFNFYVNEMKCKFDILCWHKTNALPAYKNKYLSDTEYCLYFRKGGFCDPSLTETEDRYENAKTFYLAPLNQKDKKLYGHPTIKPLDFTEKLVKNSSREGQVILDPFMGSGTTGVACKKLGRDFIGIELNETYFETARNRIESA